MLGALSTRSHAALIVLTCERKDGLFCSAEPQEPDPLRSSKPAAQTHTSLLTPASYKKNHRSSFKVIIMNIIRVDRLLWCRRGHSNSLARHSGRFRQLLIKAVKSEQNKIPAARTALNAERNQSYFCVAQHQRTIKKGFRVIHPFQGDLFNSGALPCWLMRSGKIKKKVMCGT